MSLFKKPSELTAKPGLVAMIYGSPGSGKSTLACSAPSAVMIDTDGGVMRINGAHQVPTLQVEKWEDILEAINELRTDPQVETVIVDTVGKMMSFIEDYIKRTATGKKIEINRDGTLSLKGFGARKNIFSAFIKSITVLGKNVIFVAHDKEEKRGDETVIRPEVGGSSTNDLMKELDLVGYMEISGGNRTISFSPTDRFYAKNTCGMPGIINIPVLVDNQGKHIAENTFMAQVIANYRQRIAESIESNRKFDDLCALIETNVDGIADAESANNFVDWLNNLEHIYNSKTHGVKLFKARVKALGLQYNKATKKYHDAEPAI